MPMTKEKCNDACAMMKIEDYDISAERGFLTHHNMDAVVMPAIFEPVMTAGKLLSGYMTASSVRKMLNQLPEFDMDAEMPKLSDAQLCMLMLRYSFLVQAYVWGEDKAATVLPRNLAVPYCKLSDRLGHFPLMPYSCYALDNWGMLDHKAPITLENVYVLQNFLGGQDENWFIMIHIEIEAKAGPAMAAIPAILEAVAKKDKQGVTSGLKKIVKAWEDIIPVFDRMIDKCDPYIYYNRVRPYIHGWKGNPALPEGLIYEGVEKFKGKPQEFRGQTGSQSSIVPVMDALLGIAHENDPMREYLDELHAYRPKKHRMFIEEVAARSTVRSFVMETQDAEMTLMYNKIIDSVQQFRSRHLEFSANYINKQAPKVDGNPVDVGTGGTPFMKYLKKHRDESRSHFIGDYQATERAPIVK